mgnify:CR=1 FL=1
MSSSKTTAKKAVTKKVSKAKAPAKKTSKPIIRQSAPKTAKPRTPLVDVIASNESPAISASASYQTGTLEFTHPYDETLLEQARTQWQLGEWERLTALSVSTLEHHPERAKLAVVVASAWQQLNDHAAARRFVKLAREWGCEKKLIAQMLIAGVYNTLGRTAALNRNESRALTHFRAAVSAVAGNATFASNVRAVSELQRVGLAIGEAGGIMQSNMHLSLFQDKSGKLPSPLKDELLGVVESFKAEIKADLALGRTNPYVHNRTMTPQLNNALRDFYHTKLGKPALKTTYIDYLASKAIQVEKNCTGRLATTVQDAVARQLVAECVAGNRLCVLEIGALYGISLAILYNHGVTRYEKVDIICLDPFDGFYGSTDPILNSAVNDLTFLRNMQLGNVPREDFHLIKHYSTEPAALAAAQEYKINLLVIDGDHSYAGVKFDYENFLPLLEPGGYVIIDDYNAKEWPDVQKFVDEEVMKDSRCEYIGAISRTAVMRKKDAAKKP